jgi:hypothetical protein
VSCAFEPCDDTTKATCPLSGGCVVALFAHLPRYTPKSMLEAEGLRADATQDTGKKKPPKRK